MDSIDKKNDSWFFFSNYAHVLVCLTHNPQPTTREMAVHVGITERAVQRILVGLVQADVIRVEKMGRRNHYIIDMNKQLRHPLEAHKTVGEFIKLIDHEFLIDE